MNVDPLLEPGNGPTHFPFDPAILYEIKIDNDHDAVEDVVIQFRFESEFQLPGVPVGLIGINDGANDPETGSPVVPPRIDGFDDPGLNLRQRYTVRIVDVTQNSRGRARRETTDLTNADGSPLFVVPVNAGPRTIDYQAVFNAGTYTNLSEERVSVFVGTVDDPFFFDLGAAFDTLNFRALDSGIPGVLTQAEDTPSPLTALNYAGDGVSGYAVNTLAIELPIELLTSTGNVELATAPTATIGVWATTSRQRQTVRRPVIDDDKDDFILDESSRRSGRGAFQQVQRMGNPLINELLIGIGSKNRWSMAEPEEDEQFANFFLDPVIVQAAEAIFGELLGGGRPDFPEAPRNDLLLLAQYLPPIAASGTPTGPIADLIRLNTGVPPTAVDQASRLGVIGGDLAGYPNGRRLFDDVVDITLRVAVGGVLQEAFNVAPNNRLGDGVNVNDVLFRTSFPYVANSPDGRNRRHIDPGEEFPDGRPVPVD